MLDVKNWVYGKLIADMTLQGLLDGAGKIFYYYPNDFLKVPVVAYYEISQVKTSQDYYDNVANYVQSSMQLDVYHKSNYQAIIERIDVIMAGLLFNLDFSTDLYETDSKMYHRTMRYSRTLSSEDLI